MSLLVNSKQRLDYDRASLARSGYEMGWLSFSSPSSSLVSGDEQKVNHFETGPRLLFSSPSSAGINKQTCHRMRIRAIKELLLIACARRERTAYLT